MKMMISILLALSFIGTVGAQKQNKTVRVQNLNTLVPALMQASRVNGLALAVIDQGKVVYVQTFGKRNLEKNLPLESNTIMYGASFTKSAFAYMVLQLEDEGKLNLDASLADLLPMPVPEYEDYTSLKDDPRWKLLSPRLLLSHQSGFANLRWLEVDQTLKIHFTPGARYGYSGEGYYLLQLVLEQGLKLDIRKEMQKRVFDKLGMPNSDMQWRADFANNLADGYGVNGNFEPHDERSNVSAAGSMDTSINDQSKMWAGIVGGIGLSPQNRRSMWQPQIAIKNAHQFPSLDPSENKSNRKIKLSSGLGVINFRDFGENAFFKGGHNDFTGNFAICWETQKRCIVMMSNDVRAEKIYPSLVKEIVGATQMPWQWEYH